MWVFVGLLPGLIILCVIGGGIALLMRRGSHGWNVQFSGVLRAYVAVAMLVGIFLVADGAGLLLKAGFAQAGSRDFSYNNQPYTIYQPVPAGKLPTAPGVQTSVDPSDSAIRDDIATAVSLIFVGGVLFAIHAFGAAVLRRRGAQGDRLVTRAYNLVGLSVATLGFIGTGAEALNDVMRRYVVGGDVVQTFEVRHPGDPLSVAIVLLPLVVWFGWRTWEELGGGASQAHAPERSAAAHEAPGAA